MATDPTGRSGRPPGPPRARGAPAKPWRPSTARFARGAEARDAGTATACVLLGLVALMRPSALPPWLGSVVWALLVVVVAAAAWRLACALDPEAPPAVRAIASGLLGLVLASLVVTFLGFARALSLGSALILTGAAGLLAVRVVPRAPGSAQAGLPAGSVAGPPRGRVSAGGAAAAVSARGLASLAGDPILAAAAALAAVAIGLVVLSQARYVTSGVDGLWYHLPMVAEWMQHGSIWAVDGLSLVYRGYPGFRESVLLFLSLPLHQEHLALLGPVEFPLFALGVFALATAAGVPARLGALLAAYAVSVPVVARASTSQKNDLLLAVAFTAAVVLAARLVERPAPGTGVLTGAALGALAATKFTGLGYAAAVLVVGAGRQLLARPREPSAAGRRRAASLARAGGPWAWAAGAALLVAGPWYARNVLAFGNPFHPAEVTVGPFVLFEGPLATEAIAAESVGWNLRPLLDVSGLFVEAYGPLLPLAGLGAALLALGALAGRRAARPGVWLLALAAAAITIFVRQPLNMPAPSDYHYTFRYFTPAFVLLSVAALAVVAAAPRVVVAASGVLLVAGTLLNVGTWARRDWIVVAAVVAVAAAGLTATPAIPAGLVTLWSGARSAWRGRRPRPARPRLPIGVIAALVALALAAAAMNAARARWQDHPVYGYPAALANRAGVGDVWAHVHRTLARQRIVAYGMEPTFPLYGDDLSNRVVAVREPLDPAAILRRCDAERADYLVVFFPPPGSDPRWSPTTAATLLAEHPDRVSLAFSSDRTFLLKLLPRS